MTENVIAYKTYCPLSKWPATKGNGSLDGWCGKFKSETNSNDVSYLSQKT
jgi:hypothetical protein